MEVGDLVRWSKHTILGDGYNHLAVGIVSRIWKDPAWKELQVEVLWECGFWTQSINNLEVISESR